MTIPEQILKLAQEGLELWKVFISTRQEAYERKMDKRQVMAIEWAERAFRRIGELDLKDKELKKCEDKFFKYN